MVHLLSVQRTLATDEKPTKAEGKGTGEAYFLFCDWPLHLLASSELFG